MSYPNIIYGSYGDEKVAQSARIGNLPVGTLMVLPDGRKFRHAKNGGTALAAGVIVASSAETAGHGNVSGSGLLASASGTNAVGDTTVDITTKSAAVTKDQFAGGFLNVLGPAASTYIGQVYKIKSNASAAVSSRLTITLEPSDPLKVAWANGSTLTSLRQSAFQDQIVFTAANAPTGVAPTAVSASFYFWVQRTGEASVIQSATVLVVGEGFTADTAAAGSATAPAITSATASSIMKHNLGFALGAAAASQAVFVNLMME